MLKIIHRYSNPVVISRVSNVFEVKLVKTSQFQYTRKYHILNQNIRLSLCTSCTLTKKSSKYSNESILISPLISGGILKANLSTDNLPDAPTPPVIQDTITQLAQTSINGEPTFASMGLGGWSPVGILQNCMEYMHITFDLPWWSVIVMGTVMVRFAMFPLVVLAQRNNALMHNHLPQMQVLQLKMSDARKTGNHLDAARYSQELMLFMKKKGLNPLRNMIPVFVQAPFFISFFLALRRMAYHPVTSLTTGGLFWFTDLTVPDQFYILPLITSVSMWCTIELGTDGARLSSTSTPLLKYFLRALPVIMFPFIMNFPGAILCYWASTNIISLGQVAFLKIPAVREYLKIPKLVYHDPGTLPMKSKGFVNSAKDSWTNLKITREMEDRQRVDEIIFNKAGKGPIQKTYKYDPTKLTAVSAKKST